MFKKMLGSALNKYSGKKDFLEAVCAANALTVFADGEASDAEIEGAVKTISANATLTTAFNSREIERCMTEMLKRAQGGRMGRMGLYTEIEEACGDADQARDILLAAVDVADADGEISPEEMNVLEKIAGKVNVDLKAVLEA